MATKQKEMKFSDLAKLSDREVQMVLREVDTIDLALAMTSAGTAVKGKMFSNVSQRVATMLREEMSYMKAAGRTSEEARAVQHEILHVVQLLHAAGQLEWPPKGRRSKPKKAPASLKREVRNALKKSLGELSFEELDGVFASLAEVARLEGIFALDGLFDGADPFVGTAIRLIVDGTEPGLVVNILEAQQESLLRAQEIKYRKVVEGVMSIQSGDNPRIVEQKLKSLY